MAVQPLAQAMFLLCSRRRRHPPRRRTYWPREPGGLRRQHPNQKTAVHTPLYFITLYARATRADRVPG